MEDYKVTMQDGTVAVITGARGISDARDTARWDAETKGAARGSLAATVKAANRIKHTCPCGAETTDVLESGEPECGECWKARMRALYPEAHGLAQKGA